MIAIWSYFLRRTGTVGLTATSKSKSKVYVEDETKLTFENIAGVDQAQTQELSQKCY